MDLDDEGPPPLVGIDTELEPDEKPVKVPITIVTGVCGPCVACYRLIVRIDRQLLQDTSVQARRRC